MTGEVIFEPLPPTSKSGPGSSSGWCDLLRARPGEWARLPVSASNRAYYRARGFEIVRRTVDGEKRTYGRYVGNPE